METIAIGDNELLEYVIEKDFEDTVSRIILSLAERFGDGVSRTRLCKLLLGKDPGYILEGRQDLLDLFGRLKVLDADELLDFVESLIRLGLLSITNPDMPRLLLTPEGKRALGSDRLIPAQIPWPLPAIPLPLPYDRDLFVHMRKARNAIAREEGVPPYCVANNISLVEMINREAEDLGDLASIPGFGESRCERYGERLLEVLADHSGTKAEGR